MKLATIRTTAGTSAVAAIVGDLVYDLTELLAAVGTVSGDLGEVMDSGSLATVNEVAAQITEERDASWGRPISDTVFLPPIPRPANVLAIAANYRAHILETGVIEEAKREEASPWLFSMPRSSLNAHRSAVTLPVRFARNIDWEGELAVIIGTKATRVDAVDALDYVAGYTVVNDISARRMEVPERTKIRDRDTFHDWLHGKWFDTFCCVGPWMVTADEIPDPSVLRLSLAVNNELYQNASTGDMIFTTQEIISFASHLTTLEPGDIIALGTPSGVGKATGRFLMEGDVMTVTIDAIGTLENAVVAGE